MYRCIPAVFLVVLAAILGCGRTGSDGPKTVKAGGKVTLDGAAVGGADVSFSPAAKGGRAAIGKTDAQGRFTLAIAGGSGGVVPGDYRVGISKEKTEGAMTPEQAQEHFAKTGQGPPPAKVTNELPDKYKDPANSGLTAKVEAGGTNDFPFDLKK